MKLAETVSLNTKLRLVGYIRVSTEQQQDGTSLEQQAAMIEKWCADNGHELVKIFSDADSGENIAGRAGFKDAVRFCCGVISRVFKAKGKQLFSAAQTSI